MSKTYKAEEIKNSERVRKQINQREIVLQILETVMEMKYPLKDFDLNDAIEELALDAAKARGIISTELVDPTPEELFGKCLALLQDTQSMTGAYFDTAQQFISEIQKYLSRPDIEESNKALMINKKTSL